MAPGLDLVELFQRVPHAMSAADIEGILVRASRRMAAADRPTLTAELLHDLIADFQPPAYPLEIEYQTLIAAIIIAIRFVTIAPNRPKANASGVPHKSASIKSRRLWSVPASPCRGRLLP